MIATDPAVQANLNKLDLALTPIQDAVDLTAAKEDGDTTVGDKIRGATKLAEAGVMFDLNVDKTTAAGMVASLIRMGLAKQACQCDGHHDGPDAHRSACELHYESAAAAVGGKRYCPGCAEAAAR